MKKIVKRFCLPAIGLLVLTGVAGAADVPPAAPAEPAPLTLLKDIEVHGFASTAYNYNFNKPSTSRNALRTFDRDDNSFKFDVGELVLLKNASNKGDVGFRTDIAYGFSVPEVTKARAGTGDVQTHDFDLQQAYVSYNAPLGNGLRLDMGKFITNFGSEVIEGYDNWNYNYSHSFLFGLAIPFVHTGVRANYTVNDNLSFGAMVANGWDNETDNNRDKTVHVMAVITPTKNFALTLNWMGGPEQNGDTSNWRNLYDAVATIGVTDTLTLSLNVDYGTEEKASAINAGQDADWWGFAGVIRHQCSKAFAVNLRGEYFKDEDGTRASALGAEEKLWEITVTPELRINNNLLIRAEYRHDKSNLNAFNDSGVAKNRQDTVALNALFFF